MNSIRTNLYFPRVKNLLKPFYLSPKMNLSTNSRIKTIDFKTCGQLYEELKKKNSLYKNSPSDGLPVSIEYVDTLANDNLKSDDMKTVVAIHGNPGHHKHFSELIEFFGRKESNVRLIVPNMLDFSITRKTMAFWHSNEERSQFIRDFLKAINVSTIDCLISHSAGIHPISLIWTDPRELTVGSIGIFNPQYISETFFTMSKRLSIFSRSRFGIAIADLMKPHILARGHSPMTYESVDEVLFFVLVHSYIQNSDFHKKLEALKSLQIPTLLVFGEKDKLIKSELFREMAHQKLGADHKDFVIYSEDKEIEKDSDRENWIKVLVLKGGGHFAFAKYSEEVCKQVIKHCLQSKL